MFLTNLNAAPEWISALERAEDSANDTMNLSPGETRRGNNSRSRASNQVLLVLEGELLAEVEEETARLRQGDVMIIPTGVSYRFHNGGTEAARTYAVYT